MLYNFRVAGVTVFDVYQFEKMYSPSDVDRANKKGEFLIKRTSSLVIFAISSVSGVPHMTSIRVR